MKLFFTGLFAILLSVQITAAESESTEETATEEKKPVKPMEPLGLRNDRLLAKQLGDSEAKWLSTGKTQFLGVFNADRSGKALGSLLILPSPSRNVVAAGLWPQFATELSFKGWNTLGISLPIFEFSAPAPNFPKAKVTIEESTEETAEETSEVSTKSNETIPDEVKWYSDQATKNMAKLAERLIPAEVELLKNNGRYVIVAQGTTAEIVLELISSKVIKPSGLITLNIQHPVYQRSSKIPKNLAAIKIPILDIYNFSNDVSVSKRKAAQRGKKYRQLYIPGNDMNFRGSEKLLIKRIRGWLKTTYSKGG